MGPIHVTGRTGEKPADKFRTAARATIAGTKDVEKLGLDLDIGHNPLGWHLMNAVLDTFNDLYKNGMKPVPAGYFGRDDL